MIVKIAKAKVIGHLGQDPDIRYGDSVLMHYLKNFARRIYLFFFRIPELPRRKRKIKQEAGFGQFTTIKSVLNALDSMFDDMRLLRPRKKEFQRLVKKYGPYICSLDKIDHRDKDAILAGALGAGFKAYGLPTFLISYRAKFWYEYRDDEPVSEFFVARKQTSLPFIRPKNRVCYECCFIGMLGNEPLELYFNIGIDKNGNVEAYPYLAKYPIRIKGRVVSSKLKLYYPDLTPEQSADIEKRKDFLVEMFTVHYNMVMLRETGINIIVKKGKDRATITVPPNRWKYFFKDRDSVKTPSGRKKPIFHAVASHHRHYKTGKIAPVKTHYRGARSFSWDGYDVKIVLPGKHAKAQASFGVAGEIIEEADFKSGDYIDIASNKAANEINAIFEGER